MNFYVHHAIIVECIYGSAKYCYVGILSLQGFENTGNYLSKVLLNEEILPLPPFVLEHKIYRELTQPLLVTFYFLETGNTA